MGKVFVKSQIKYNKSLKKWVLPNGVKVNGRGVTRFLYPQIEGPPTDRMKLGRKFAEKIENNLTLYPALNDWVEQNLVDCKREAFVYGDVRDTKVLGFVDLLSRYKLIDIKLTQEPVEQVIQRPVKIEYCAQLAAYGYLKNQVTGIAPQEYGILWVNLRGHSLKLKDFRYQIATTSQLTQGFNYFVNRLNLTK